MPKNGGGMIVLSDDVRGGMKGIPPCFESLLISRSVFTLDDAGHISEVATYTSDSSLIGRQIYDRRFDSRGNWIEESASEWNFKSAAFQKSSITYRTIIYY